MDFKVIYDSFGRNGFVVEFSDGRTVLINLMDEITLEDDVDVLIQFGMWQETKEQPAGDIIKEIEDVLKKNGY